MSVYVDKFIRQHSEYFNRNKSFIESNNWNEIDKNKQEVEVLKNQLIQISKTLDGKELEEKQEEITDSLTALASADQATKAKLFKQEQELTTSIVGRLSSFIKTTEKLGDRGLPKTQKFIEETVSIINIFIKKCDLYLAYKMDTLTEETTTDKEIELKSQEIKFQDVIFGAKIKIQDNLDNLNIGATVDSLEVTFFKNEKASLIMKEPLTSPKYFDIKEKVEGISVDWNVRMSKEMFINMNPKDIPQWNHKKHFFDQDPVVLQFWSEELNKVIHGININGFFVHPWLYFHLNFFRTPIPQKDGTESPAKPDLRDNEWFFSENLKECISKDNPNYYSKAMLIYGTRRFGKSVILASLAHWKLITKYYSNATVVGGSSSDLNALTSKIQTSMAHIEAPFRLDTIKQNWDGKNGGETTFGIKEDASTPIIYSSLIVQNLEEGQKKSKSQKTAGGAPSVSIYDEIGKYAFLKAYLAALPSFATPYGFKCVTVLAGCVCAGTKVWTNSGKLVNIEDLNQEEGIIGYNGEDYSKEPITNINPPQEKECIRIETEGGEFIECSVDHPFLTTKHPITNRKQVLPRRADELTIGDNLFTLNDVDIFGDREVKDARVIGLLIGDGTYLPQCVQLSCGDDEIFEYVTKNYSTHAVKEFTTTKGSIFRAINVHGLCPTLKSEGIFGQSKSTKRLPKDIHTYSKESLCELLGGYFDADGNVKYDEKKNNIRICLTSIVEPLLEEVKYQLYKLGIHCTISKENRSDTPTEKFKGRKDYIYRLYINREESVIKFHKNISFLCKHKQDNLEKVFLKKRSNSTRGTANNLKFNIDTKGKGAFFLDKKLNNLQKKRITKIEKIGVKPIYNLTAGKTHTYIANGFVTFNTGGEADLSADAVGVLSNPELYDLLPMNWDLLENHLDPDEITWKRRSYATFFPGQMAYEKGFVKEVKPFGEWINNDAEEFNKIKIHVTNWNKNNKYLDDKIAEAKKDKSKNAKLVVQQRKVQYPRDPEDTFMSGDSNKFPTEEAQKKKKYLEDNKITGEQVILYKSKTGKIETIDASEKELPEFPFQGGFSEAPVIIYERPHDRVEDSYLLYIAGLDDYNLEESSGDSLGSFCIYKRNLMDESSNKVVAIYNARPDPHKKFHEQGLFLLEMYNARCYMENADTKFKDYLDGEHLSDRWLVQGFDPGSEYSFNTSNRRKYGWQPTEANVKFMMGRLLDYSHEIIEVEDEEGNIKTILGVERIDDIGILNEIIGYTKDGNFDRLRSFGSCLMYDLYLTSQYISAKLAKPEIPEHQKPAKRSGGGLFGKSGGGFFSR